MTVPPGGPPAAAFDDARRRLVEQLHAGVVQQVTAMSLAIDSAMLHLADGDPAAVDAALRSARETADAVVRDCRTLMDDLRPGP